jgi:hypothetical protein
METAPAVIFPNYFMQPVTTIDIPNLERAPFYCPIMAVHQVVITNIFIITLSQDFTSVPSNITGAAGNQEIIH